MMAMPLSLLWQGAGSVHSHRSSVRNARSDGQGLCRERVASRRGGRPLGRPYIGPVEAEDAKPRRWKVTERRIDGSRKLELGIAAVELPDGVCFEQYVLRVPAAAIVAVVDEHNRILMLRRHRFIIDRSVWELPGGYVDPGEDGLAAAAREVEEETGWRPSLIEHALTFQPMIGLADARNDLYIGRGATPTGNAKDINEAEEIAWLPLDEATSLIHRGDIVGAASVMAILHLAAGR
jgi:8-oxo-dGTP pyrophosphatase MutT (NUDIX family)